MAHRRLGNAIGRIATLEGTHHPPATPGLRARDDRPGELVEIVELEREAAERISGQRVEAGGDEDDVRHEARRRGVDCLLQRRDVLVRGQTAGARYVPHGAVWPTVLGRASPRI